MNINYYIGKRYNRLTILSYAGKDKQNKRAVNVLCDCGNKKKVSLNNLNRGHTKSCGCLLKDVKTTHGMGSTTVYGCWFNILSRCYNPKNKHYDDYGKRGIKVCERWHNIKNFVEDMGEKPKNLTIERLDNNGNYEKNNCKWATMKEQNRNKRNNKTITYKNKTKCMADWAKEMGVCGTTLYRRLTKMGWGIEKAIETESKKARCFR